VAWNCCSSLAKKMGGNTFCSSSETARAGQKEEKEVCVSAFYTVKKALLIRLAAKQRKARSSSSWSVSIFDLKRNYKSRIDKIK
jgi:hypothetical protein